MNARRAAGWIGGAAAGTVLAVALGTLLAPEPVDLPLPPEPSAAEPPPPPIARAPRETYVEPIVGRSIFDSSQIGREIDSIDSTGLPSTDLAVVLLATAVTDPPDYSSALIAPEGKGEEGDGYGVGDHIEDATIAAIDPGRVTLERANGRHEVLVLWEGGTVSRSSGGSGGGGSLAIGVGSEEAPPAEPEVTEDDVARVLDGKGQLGLLFGSSRPYADESGEVSGIQLISTRNSAFAKKAGLESGDVLHSIDGQPVTSAQEAAEVALQWEDSSEATLEVSRGGKRHTVQLDFR